MRSLLLPLSLVLLGASPALATPSVGAPPIKKKPAPAPAPAPAPTPAPTPAPALKKGQLPDPNQQFTDPYGYNRSLWGSGRFVTVPVGGGVGGNAPMVVGGQAGQAGPAGPQAPNVVVGSGAGDLSLTAPQLVKLLADPLYSPEGKLQTETELLQGGLSSVPALVASLRDRSSYAVRDLPGENGKTEQVKVTVGEECEALLYHIVTPRYRSPHEAGVKPQNPTIFTIKNWPSWWDKNKGKTLQQVHTDIRATIDRYWQAGGVEQVLE